MYGKIVLIEVNKGATIQNNEKKLISKNLNQILEEFWNIDCLIRITKEILSNNNWETQEEDIYTICNILSKSSKELSNNIGTLKELLQ